MLALTCMTQEGGYIADSFKVGWPPLRIRPGSPMLVRFERPEQPSEVEIRGPRGVVDFSLQAYEQDGSVTAWEARFAAPGPPPRRKAQERGGETYYTVVPIATWTGDEDCPSSKRGEWGVTLQKRKARG